MEVNIKNILFYLFFITFFIYLYFVLSFIYNLFEILFLKSKQGLKLKIKKNIK